MGSRLSLFISEASLTRTTSSLTSMLGLLSTQRDSTFATKSESVFIASLLGI